MITTNGMPESRQQLQDPTQHPDPKTGLQALARMGAHVTGIEPQLNNIKAAVAHAQADPVVAERTTYLAVTAEELASTGEASFP